MVGGDVNYFYFRGISPLFQMQLQNTKNVAVWSGSTLFVFPSQHLRHISKICEGGPEIPQH